MSSVLTVARHTARTDRVARTRVLVNDHDTPLAVYRKLANAPWTFLLESVQGGERFARYSFIGLPAATRIEVRGNQIRVLTGDLVVEAHTTADPLAFLREYIARHQPTPHPDLPRFAGGLVGYLGYDMARCVERRLDRRPRKPTPAGTPDALFLVCDAVAVVDNLRGTVTLVVHHDADSTDALQAAERQLDDLERRLAGPVEAPLHPRVPTWEVEVATPHDTYLERVRHAKDLITAGELMQVQLAQRFSRRFEASPLALYRALRRLNPSPYMMYFDFGDHHVVSASPEILVRTEGDRVTVRPIAGTRRRGATLEEDAALAAELLADEKERAEHVMLIDLGRNDVGRVATPGTVAVTDQMVIERYSHVMHIVSNVEGRLRPGHDAIDVLRATFPAGTVTGAPKVRAMEVIDDLETEGRGIYAGAAGYLDVAGDMDMAITIRTAIVTNGQLHVQAAAGIVADSDPESEWRETQIKARALLRAAELADAGLPGSAT